MALLTPLLALESSEINSASLETLFSTFEKEGRRAKTMRGRIGAFNRALQKIKRDPELYKEYQQETKQPVRVRVGTPTLHWEVTVYGIPPEFVNEVMLNTMEDWVSFAMGNYSGGVGAGYLKNPTGAYAKSISLTSHGRDIDLMANSPIADIVETGRSAFNLAQRMDFKGKKMRWLSIPAGKQHDMPSYFYLREGQKGVSVDLPGAAGGSAAIENRRNDRGPRRAIPIYPHSKWMIPAMRAHNIAQLLSARLEREFNRIH